MSRTGIPAKNLRKAHNCLQRVMSESKSSDERSSTESELESKNLQAKRTEQVELAEFLRTVGKKARKLALY